ncbi:uncharacterized protein LOC117694286 [Arvicanthis niloticus]|uniref:uncharacterized protein LOC117694286 n=1 Tax=Arvicanthis niloticus TaxID=61156 RepID=UPI001486B20F|nr:uncharacterized protein LOC117694286 [Arvicanthis niloticus]
MVDQSPFGLQQQVIVVVLMCLSWSAVNVHSNAPLYFVCRNRQFLPHGYLATISKLPWRFAGVKEWIFRVTGFLCSLLSLGCGIILASSRYWRLWEFDDKVVHLVYIGLWEVYYHWEFNFYGTETIILVQSPVNSTWTISPEFQCAWSLILLAMLIKPVVVIFSSAAIRVSIIKASVPEILIMCYKFSVLILIFSSFCTIISVTWNHIVDLYGKAILDFPPTFPVKKEALIIKHGTHVFPIGILTTTLSLFGVIMFLFEIRSPKIKNKLNAYHASKQADDRSINEGSVICKICQESA